MYQIKIQGKVYQIELDDEQSNVAKVNGKSATHDIKNLGNGMYSVIKENKSYTVQVLKSNYEDKAFDIKVNGAKYKVKAKDRHDIILKELGLSGASGTKTKDLKAPMPGKVLELKAGLGDKIKENEPLIILEAMKMENILKASADGIIDAIEVKIGDSVEKNEVLIRFK
ncbi:MAG TPA: acetyl-CoA carboxylase biotin carboxyl carrier protein subunit [Flavobacteriales bacterium]|nr:acetyl-CoA carboxylase biotin carboxyl carrier protein subunit [Flavobacteriales bacterium]HIN39312.1 acetyl-CoA carboxylase biotin carboxyl carrier protein subunit [Flavobacteriales bacterium]